MSVEVIHIPVVTDVLRAFQLLDYLAHGELAGDSAPCLVICVAPVKDHEGIGMPKHPSQGMHGACLEPHTGCPAISRITHKRVHIHKYIGPFGCQAVAAHFTGAGQFVLQAVDCKSFKEMWGRIDHTVGRRSRDLRIIIYTGTPVEAGHKGMKTGDRRIDAFQRKPLHGSSAQQAPPAGSAGRPKVFQGISQIGDRVRVAGCFSCFTFQNPGSAVPGPFHPSVGKVISVEIPHLIPDVPVLIDQNGFDLYSRVLHEITQVSRTVLG